MRVRILRPQNTAGETLPVILYMHGGGWVLGNAGTHDRLVRELVVGTGAALAFVEYDRSPEARYPVAIEQGYAVARHITQVGAQHGLDPTRMAVAGDSVGGCMTAALTLMAEGRGDVRFVFQAMFYPVTDAAMDTESYRQFAEGYYLSAKAMAWFWDAYAPDLETRKEAYASPMQAVDQQLAGLPPALLIVDEADVLRDEGEAYASRLRAAGVSGDHRPLRRRHPRLHDAQPAERDPRHARGDRAGHRDPEGGPAMRRLALALAAAFLLTAGTAEAAKPTIVLVHGAFADASGFADVTNRLQDRGYTVIAPANPLRDLPGDAAYVASVIKDAGPVVLVGHSYGGAVITEVGGAPNVKALVYIDGMALDVGESTFDIAATLPRQQAPAGAAAARLPDRHGPLHRPGELPRRVRGRPPGPDDQRAGRPPAARHAGRARGQGHHGALEAPADLVPGRDQGRGHPAGRAAVHGQAREGHDRRGHRFARVLPRSPEGGGRPHPARRTTLTVRRAPRPRRAPAAGPCAC